MAYIAVVFISHIFFLNCSSPNTSLCVPPGLVFLLDRLHSLCPCLLFSPCPHLVLFSLLRCALFALAVVSANGACSSCIDLHTIFFSQMFKSKHTYCSVRLNTVVCNMAALTWVFCPFLVVTFFDGRLASQIISLEYRLTYQSHSHGWSSQFLLICMRLSWLSRLKLKNRPLNNMSVFTCARLSLLPPC